MTNGGGGRRRREARSDPPGPVPPRRTSFAPGRGERGAGAPPGGRSATAPAPPRRPPPPGRAAAGRQPARSSASPGGGEGGLLLPPAPARSRPLPHPARHVRRAQAGRHPEPRHVRASASGRVAVVASEVALLILGWHSKARGAPQGPAPYTDSPRRRGHPERRREVGAPRLSSGCAPRCFGGEGTAG